MRTVLLCDDRQKASLVSDNRKEELNLLLYKLINHLLQFLSLNTGALGMEFLKHEFQGAQLNHSNMKRFWIGFSAI